MKTTLDQPRAVAPTSAGSLSRPRWWSHLGSAAFWGVVVVLLGGNLDRARNLRPAVAPGAITTLIERNQLDDAVRALRDRLRRNPFEGDSRLALGQLALRRGDMAEAAATFRLVPAWWPSKPEALLLEGRTALAAGLAVEAEAAWRACLADDPLHPTAPRTFSAAAGELIGLLSLEGRQSEAVATLQAIHAGSSPADRPAVLRTIADLQSRGTRFPTDPAALDRLERCARADPRDVTVRLALAGAARSAGRWIDARRWVNAALAIRPDDPAALAALRATPDPPVGSEIHAPDPSSTRGSSR